MKWDEYVLNIIRASVPSLPQDIREIILHIHDYGLSAKQKRSLIEIANSKEFNDIIVQIIIDHIKNKPELDEFLMGCLLELRWLNVSKQCESIIAEYLRTIIDENKNVEFTKVALQMLGYHIS